MRFEKRDFGSTRVVEINSQKIIEFFSSKNVTHKKFCSGIYDFLTRFSSIFDDLISVFCFLQKLQLYCMFQLHIDRLFWGRNSKELHGGDGGSRWYRARLLKFSIENRQVFAFLQEQFKIIIQINSPFITSVTLTLA